jgi:Flp pilus assembly protein TadG
MKTRKRSPRPRPRGQAVTEFSLVVPLLALILMGCLDLGRAFHVHMAAANAAHVGLMYAQQGTDPTDSASITPADVISRTVNAAQGSLDASQMQVSVCVPGACPITDTSSTAAGQPLGNGEPITVSVTMPFTTITPFVHLTSVGGSASGSTLPLP